MTTFDAKCWVENEIDQMMDLYGNTRRQAARFVLDLIQEDGYDEMDDIDDSRISEVVRVLQGILG